MAQVHFDGIGHTRSRVTDTAIVHVVRVRETQEYDVEVTTTGNSREAAKLARGRFMGMTVVEQAANSIGITGRSFEAGEEEFDENELAGE
jgi:hypothetical protein